jgi:voltage-gated potassium channel
MELFHIDTSNIFARLKKALVVIVAVCLFATVLVHEFEGIGWLDSLFLVIDSMTHAHFGGYPVNTPTKIVMTFLTVFGVGVLAYLVSILVEISLCRDIFEFFGLRGMEKRMRCMNEHVIVCGYGRVGSVVVAELVQNKFDFIVIEQDDRLVEELQMNDINVIQGDATDVHTLQRACIGRAKFLIIALGDDADTIVVTLAAKEMNPRIRVIVRASSEKMMNRMFQIGVERIVSPEYVGGLEIAESILHKQLASKRGLITKEDIKEHLSSDLNRSDVE